MKAHTTVPMPTVPDNIKPTTTKRRSLLKLL